MACGTFGAVVMSVRHWTQACRAPPADRRDQAAGRIGQLQELFDYPEDESWAIHGSEFVTEALEMRVDRMRRDAEVSGDGELGAIVEHAADDLQFAFSEAEAASDFSPDAVGENGGASVNLGLRTWGRLPQGWRRRLVCRNTRLVRCACMHCSALIGVAVHGSGFSARRSGSDFI